MAARKATREFTEPEKGLFAGPLDRDLTEHFEHDAYSFYLRYGMRLGGGTPPLSLHDFLSQFERAVMFETLMRTHGSQKRAADFLHLKKQTLSMKLKKQRIHIAKIPV